MNYNINIKIQLETIDIIMRLWGYDIGICMVYNIKPRSDVCCFKLNFNVSSMGYCEFLNDMLACMYMYASFS